MNTVLKITDKVLQWLLAFCVGLIAAGVIVSVILRYVFNLSFVWAEELMTIVFVATTFFGAALGVREKEYISITGLLDALPEKLKKAFHIIVYLIIATVSAVIFYYSLVWIQRVGSVPSPATGIKNGLYYLIVPISFGITVFYSLVNIAAEFISIDKPTLFLESQQVDTHNKSEEPK